jgi:glutamyl-tRNA reductase
VNFVLVGLNHKTAPVELRERFALTDDSLHAALVSLYADFPEVVILSTCNRLEVYAAAECAETAYDVITAFLAEKRGMTGAALSKFLYCCQGMDVVQHLMRVVSGLESLMLGETQILGQVAQALGQAQAANSIGAILTRLFNDALHAGKRAHSQTTISRHNFSVSDAAVALLEQEHRSQSSVRALILGAGEMAELAVRALQRRGMIDLRVISRTDANAQRFAERLGIHAQKWNDLPMALNSADVVITALRSPIPIIDANMVSSPTDTGERFIVDIGVPRNVASEVGSLHGVRLYDIDDLQSVVQAQHADRQAVIAQVEAFSTEAAENYANWLYTRRVVPLISELRQQAVSVAELEVERALRRLPGLSADEQQIVAQMAHRIVNKLMHAPTVNLKERAAYGDHYDYSHAVRELFALDAEPMHDE